MQLDQKISLMIKNVVVNVFYYSVTLIAVPAALLRVESSWTAIGQTPAGLRIVCVSLGMAGALLQVWCIILLQRFGKGTPSPAFPTSKLVKRGPYRVVRNPMNMGEVMLILALAGWFGSWILLAYGIVAGLAFHVFIVMSEEPRHLQKFGRDYEEYMRSVNRWLPTFRRPLVLSEAEELKSSSAISPVDSKPAQEQTSHHLERKIGPDDGGLESSGTNKSI